MKNIKDTSSLISYIRENAQKVDLFTTDKALSIDKSKVQAFLKDRTQLVIIGVKK